MVYETFIPVEDLKVGDVIGIRKGVQIGWSNFRYPITVQKTIARITPKKTKVVTDDGCEYDTRRNWFYKITEKVEHESMIAQYAININKKLNALGDTARSNMLYKVSDDKIEKISKLLDEIMEVLS